MDQVRTKVRRVFRKRNRPSYRTLLGRTHDTYSPPSGAGPGQQQQPPPPFGPGAVQGVPQQGSSMMDTIRKPAPISEEDEDDDIESVGNYNSQPGVLRNPQLQTMQSEDTVRSGNPYGNDSTMPSTPLNPGPSPFRNPSTGFAQDARSTGTNRPVSPRPPPQGGAAALFAQIADPSRPPLRPISTPAPNQPVNNPQTSRPPSTINPPGPPQPPPPPVTTNGAIPLPGPPMNNQVVPSQNPASRDESNSRIELDYPIENVLIDANIPSTVAFKINDAVEKDRRGNPVHVHRYSFDPRSQEMNYKDQQIVPRQSDGGFRRIREITPDSPPGFRWNAHMEASSVAAPPHSHHSSYHPEQFVIHTDNLETLQSVLSQNIAYSNPASGPFLAIGDVYEEPIYYYTARALPNDPMRLF